MNDAHPPAESVSSRYAVTLGAQVFRLLVSLVTAAIVPRTLGPAIYGNYSFLLSTSAALRGCLDNGTQQAFFTFSSQERASGPLTRLYALALGVQFAVVLLLIAAAALTGRIDWLWRAQHLDQIVLVTVLDWALFIALSLQQLGDTKGLTAFAQMTGAAVAAVTLCGLLALRLTGTLDFYTFVWLNLCGALLTCGTLVYRFLVRQRALFWSGRLEARGYVRRWWRFTSPLILPQYYLPLVAYLGLYLIQRWYGSAEQGYYALALQWSAFAMVFTTSGVWIFWREVAHHAGRDLRHTARVYQRFSTLFVFLALVLAWGLSAGSRLLVEVVAGERFRAATAVLAIMAFYPISQTINQLTAASMKATERTASYARWSVLLSVPELLLTYLLLAPTTGAVPGLHLGAIGMAIKTAFYGLATALVYDWINCRFLGIGFGRALVGKLMVAAVLGAVAILLIGYGGSWLEQRGLGALAALVLSSAAYAVAVALLILMRPGMAGLTREQLIDALRSRGWRRAATGPEPARPPPQ